MPFFWPLWAQPWPGQTTDRGYLSIWNWTTASRCLKIVLGQVIFVIMHKVILFYWLVTIIVNVIKSSFVIGRLAWSWATDWTVRPCAYMRLLFNPLLYINLSVIQRDTSTSLMEITAWYIQTISNRWSISVAYYVSCLRQTESRY
jgi:hypothetical protein